MGTRVILRDVPISFPALFSAEEYEGNWSYNCKFHLEKGSENVKNVEAAIDAEAKAKFLDKAKIKMSAIRGNSNKCFFIDGDTKDLNGFAGNMIVTAKRKQADGRPAIVDRNKKPLQESDGLIYSGAICNSVVEVWAQDGKNEGMRCSLISVQYVSKGAAWGGAPAATTDGLDDLGYDGDDDDDLA